MLHDTALPNAIPVQFDEAGILAEFPAATPALARLVAELRMTTTFLSDPSKTADADTRERLQVRLREVRGLIESFPTATVADIGLKAEATRTHTGSAEIPIEPTDLADACAWVVRHRVWLDSEDSPDGDEALAAEIYREEAIFVRAAATPATSLRDIWGKAQLALDEVLRFHIENRRDVDNGILLIKATLQDAIRLCDPTSTRPGTPITERIQADPALACIAEARAALDSGIAAEAASTARGEGNLPEAFNDAVDDALSALGRIAPPSTLTGCQALARLVCDMRPGLGLDLDDEMPGILELIAGGSDTLTAPSSEDDTVESAATLSFDAYDFDAPVKTPKQWSSTLAEQAMGFHLADRTLRMAKPEMMAFICDAEAKSPGTPEIMFKMLSCAQETFEGYGKLLHTARSRYIVAASAVAVEEEATAHV